MRQRTNGRHRGVRFTAAIAAGALVLAACGGDDSGSGGGGSASDWCSLARAFSEQDDVFGDEDMPDAGSMREGMREAVRAVEQLERVAPGEIRDDVRLMASGMKQLNDALAKVDYNFFALLTDPEAAAALEALDSPDLEAASERIDAYTLRECGFRLDDTSGDPFGDDPFGDDSGDDPFGDDSGDDPSGDDSGDDTSDDPFDFGNNDAMIDAMAQMYASIYGLTQDQARCFTEKIFAMGEDDFDPTTMAGDDIPFLTECGISPEDFSPGG